MHRPTYLAISLHQSHSPLPGGPQILWRQAGVEQMAEMVREGKRVPEEIVEELHIFSTHAQYQGQ